MTPSFSLIYRALIALAIAVGALSLALIAIRPGDPTVPSAGSGKPGPIPPATMRTAREAGKQARDLRDSRAANSTREATEPAPPLSLSQLENIHRKIASEMKEAVRKRLRYDQPGQAMEFFLRKRAPEGEKNIPIEKYFAARERMKAMPLYSTVRSAFLLQRDERLRENEMIGTWSPLGPGNIGGRTRALLIHPANPQVMYAAGVAGGVWKTTNGGATWAPLTDLMANIAVCAMAMDPKNPEVIYAGTGEGFFNIDGVRGAGVFKTTDGGQTWERLPATATEDFHYVNDLVISPNDSRRIYAATETGVWRSLDGGATWTQSLKPNENEVGGCLDLAIRADRTTDYLFASFALFPSRIVRRAAVYRNTDAGGSGEWISVLSEVGMGRTSLAIAPSNQDVVYALSWGFADNSPEPNLLHGVFRSTASGDPGSWTAQVKGDSPVKLNRLLLANAIIATLSECRFGKSDFYSQGWYNNVIAVDPVDPNRVWAGGTDLFRSDDGGVNWGIASHWWPDKATPQYAHADHHAIVFHPQYDGATNKTMFAGTDGGVFRTDDARAPVAVGEQATCNPAGGGVRWTALNNNYGVTQFYHGAPFPDGKSYFGGTQDNGTLLGTDAQGANGWREIYGGDGGYVAIDPTNPNVVYTSNTGISIKKSTDGGASFSSALFGFETALGGDGGLFIAPFVMDPSNPQRLWTGGIGIWRTQSGAARWELVGDSVGTGSGLVSAIAVAPTDSNYVLVGKDTGLIHHKHNALFLIDPFSPPVPDRSQYQWAFAGLKGYISWLAFDPHNKNIAYATVSTFGVKHVWRSVDAGVTWTSIDGEGPNAFPDVPAHCIVVDPTNTARLYVGSDAGVFISVDGGATWAVENTGFANTVVESLAINTVNGVSSLYAFTHGRGAYRVTLGAGCNQPTFNPTASIGQAGGEGSLQVNAPSDSCPWRAESNASWITIISGAGQGGGVVRYSVAPNNGFERRVGTVTVGGRSFSVTQEASIDTEPPQVEFTAPVATGGVFTTHIGHVNLAWRVRENHNFALMQIERNGGLANIPVFGPKLPENQSFERAALSIGVNTFTVTVKDWAGNTTQASIKVIFLPEFLITTVAGGYFRQGYDGDGGPALQASLWDPTSATLDRNGNLFIADASNGRIRRVDARTGIITTVAGKGYPQGVFSSGDGGPALDAVLAYPLDVKVDQAGNIYISERARIRKVTTDGKINTVAGNGERGFSGDGGPATQARISEQTGIALDRDGDLYIADIDNNRIRKVTASAGVITTVAGNGTGGFGGDGGPATAAQLKTPRAITFAAAGALFIADSGNNRVRKVSAGAGVITTVAGDGRDSPFEEDALATATPILYPYGVALDAAGNLFVSSFGRIRRIGSDGRVRSIAGVPSFGALEDEVPAIQSEVGSPLLEIDAAGNIIFADSRSHRIRKIYPLRLSNGAPTVNITSPSATGSFTTNERVISLSGTVASAGSVARVWFHSDRGFSWTASGTTAWRVPDLPLKSGLNRITVTAEDPAGTSGSAVINITYNPERVAQRFAGDRLGRFGFSGDGGRASEAMLWQPRDVAADQAGNLFIADAGNYRIRKVAPDGTTTTFAGSGRLGTGGDGGQAINADLNFPSGVACDAQGNVYIADTLNHRVRKVAPNGVITTAVGDGIEDFGGDGGPATAARLSRPRGLAFDAAGNLFIADSGNSRIRRVDARTGVITTVAGNGAKDFGGDGGPATQASLDLPVDVAVDGQGALFIVDRVNKRIRKVNAAGVISTFAFDALGGGKEGDPFNPLVTFNGITIDAAGNLYVSSQADNQIRKFTPDGGWTMFAGLTTTSSGSYDTGDGGGATGINIYSPSGLAFDRAGNLYVADANAHRVLMISPYRSASNVSAASYAGPEVGSESIVTAFGNNLAASSQTATALPLPVTLAGTTVRVRDSAGVEQYAPLFFVSPSQINYQIPPGLAAGPALITITNNSGAIFTGSVQIVNAAPGLFTANASGQGLAAAVVLRIKADGAQVYEPVARFDSAQNRFVATPIDLSNPSDQVFLLLFGTGIRNRSSLASVSVKIGGVDAEALYAGAQGGFVGLDQVNARLPRSLSGRGEVDVVLTVDGKTANIVRIGIL
jgi:uncharacterized protein (TIGR03437 family)